MTQEHSNSAGFSRSPNDVNARLRALAEPLCAAHGVSLVDARWVREQSGAVVRILIERVPSDETVPYRSFVSLEDCQAVSRDLSVALDVNEIVGGRYHLEVGSPGIERPLLDAGDYARFVGFEVKLKLSRAVDGTRNVQGVLRGLADGTVTLDSDGRALAVPLDAVGKAHLVFRAK